METIIELLKAILFGIVEDITEWLPVSSTGHLILLDEFVKLKVSPAFYEMFQVVIQLGAIGAVLVLFFHKLNPFSPKKTEEEKIEVSFNEEAYDRFIEEHIICKEHKEYSNSELIVAFLKRFEK